jgi:peptidyl-prolyl cis-trans isomerase D
MKNRQIPAEMVQLYLPEVLDKMIKDRAVAYQAKRMGFEVSDEELATAIRSILANYMPVNSFNREAYERFIREQNMSVEEFESNVRKQLLLLKLQNLALEGVVVTPQDVKDEFHRRNDKVKIDYIVFSPAKFRDTVTVTRDEALNFYNKNRTLYNTPERRTFNVLIADEQKTGAAITVSDAELRQAYQANIERYRTPERVHVRHILIKTMDKPSSEVPKLEAKANELLKQARSGADFAELAKKNSDDTGSAVKGGDLDWVTRGQTVKAFEEAAFSLPPKQISNLIRTEYGFHIIQVLEKQPAQVKPFEEVRAELEKEVKRRQVYEKMQNSIEQARADLVKAPTDAQAIANKYGLVFAHADRLAAGQSVPEVGTNAELQNAVTSARQGEVTPVVQLGQDKLALAVVLSIEPPKPAEFADVEGQIMSQLKAQKGNMIAQQKREEAGQKLRAANGDLRVAAQAIGAEVKSSDFVGADGTIEGLGPVNALPDIFKSVGTVVGPISLGENVVIAKAIARQSADEAQLTAERDKILSTLKRKKALERKDLFEDGLVTQLTKQGKIKKYPDAIRRLEGLYRG